MTRGRRPGAMRAAITAALVLCAAGAGAAEDPDAAARAVLEGGRFQTELPTELPEVEPPAPPPEPGEPIRLGRLAEALLWVLAVAVLGLAVYAIATHPGLSRRLRRWRTAEKNAAAARHAVAEGAGAPGPVEEADALARQGRIDEAVHLLLLRAIEELRARVDPGLPDSLTSREVLRRLALPEGARAALGYLVDAVERTLFAGRPAGPEDYDACRRRYAALAEAV